MSCPYYTFRQNDYYCLKKQDYVNSDCYYKYCRNWDYSDCPIYKGQSTSSSCFLSTACVVAKGLPDDCYELQVLRRFRDEWLAQQEGGKEEIEAYYACAPKIVSAINDRDDAHEIYERLYEELVLACVKLIEAGDLDGAREHYRSITSELKERYQ